VPNNALVLKCEFKNYQSYWGTMYTCVATKLRTSQTERNVSGIVGQHMPGKSNNDVEKIFIENQNCPYLPINLNNYFANLKVLYIMRSGVQFIHDNDLDGLIKLKIFDVSHNPIEYCNLRAIEAGALDSLVNLKDAHFRYNYCMDFSAADSSLLPELKSQMLGLCLPKFSTTTEKLCVIEANKHVAPFSLSFGQRNGYVFIIILLLIIVLLSVGTFTVIKQKFNNNLKEVRNALSGGRF